MTTAIHFRHWQVAFEFPREEKESVGEYIARLCEAKLKDYCMSVPFEDLHFALEKPYLTEARRIVKAYLEEHPGVELNRIFEQYLADVDTRLAAWKDFPETLVVPTMKSRNPYTSQLLFTVDGQSVMREISLKFGKDWAAESNGRLLALVPEVEKSERGPRTWRSRCRRWTGRPDGRFRQDCRGYWGTTARYVSSRAAPQRCGGQLRMATLQFRKFLNCRRSWTCWRGNDAGWASDR